MKRTHKFIAVVIGLVAAAGGGWVWWQDRQAELPEYIATGNGRIEAEQVRVATIHPGRVTTVLVNEGDMVAAGQVLALMDTSEIDARLAMARANVASQQEMVAEALAAISQRESELRLARQELQRALFLLQKGVITRELADQRQSAVDTAEATLTAANARLAGAERAVDAARAEATAIETRLDDAILEAPRNGRVQYALAEQGEVLAAGGSVLTLLDLTNVYMTIFLPTEQVGRVAMTAEARIVLDAAPDYVIPAYVSFIASEAQFTPRQVETRSEREKLMFRIKVRIDPDLLRTYVDQVKTGLPGVAYVMLGSGGEWPTGLAINLPPEPES